MGVAVSVGLTNRGYQARAGSQRDGIWLRVDRIDDGRALATTGVKTPSPINHKRSTAHHLPLTTPPLTRGHYVASDTGTDIRLARPQADR